jgi:hypothetical protein
MRQAREVPDTDDYFGRDELVRGTNRWLEEWEEFRFIAEDLADLGDRRALVRVRLRGRARASGIALDEVVFISGRSATAYPGAARSSLMSRQLRKLRAAGTSPSAA